MQSLEKAMPHINIERLTRNDLLTRSEGKLNEFECLHIYPRNSDASLAKRLVKALAAIPACEVFPDEVDVAAAYCVTTEMFGWVDDLTTDGDTYVDATDPTDEECERVRDRVLIAVRRLNSNEDGILAHMFELVAATKVNVYTSNHHTKCPTTRRYASEINERLRTLSGGTLHDMGMMGHWFSTLNVTRGLISNMTSSGFMSKKQYATYTEKLRPVIGSPKVSFPGGSREIHREFCVAPCGVDLLTEYYKVIERVVECELDNYRDSPDIDSVMDEYKDMVACPWPWHVNYEYYTTADGRQPTSITDDVEAYVTALLHTVLKESDLAKSIRTSMSLNEAMSILQVKSQLSLKG